MKKVYINSISSISAQKTFDNSEFLDEVIIHKNPVIFAVEPNYKDYIPPAAARRMAKGIKMGVSASKMALHEAGLDQVDAIITGTGMGCVRDSRSEERRVGKECRSRGWSSLSSRRRHTRCGRDWSSDVCSSDLNPVIFAVEPNYKDYIPPAAARRMAKGIKMGVSASKMALHEAGLDQVDAIITGTGMGCVRDS